MRAIQKRIFGGHALQQANANPPSSSSDATSRWGSFGHKNTVIGYLLDEQYHLCCYSEIRADQEGLGYHIEHVENKSQNPARTFDYANLAASALTSDDLGVFKGRAEEVFGGHAQGKQGSNGAIDMARFISPHQADSGRFFAYLSDGRVVPADNLNATDLEQARYTIEALNLNSPLLMTRRQQWWDELDQLFQDHLANDGSLSHLAAIDLVPTSGKLSRFFSLTRQFFGPIADEALNQHAPTLL